MKLYAHSLKGHSVEDWQTLEEHAQNVATLAAKFAEPFGSPETARLLGLVHDIGKATKEFQEYLEVSNGIDDEEESNTDKPHSRKHGPDHSTHGAQWLDKNIKGVGRLLAYCSAGHHAGLPDGIADNASSLACRLEKVLPSIELMESSDKPDLSALACEVRKFLSADGFAMSFYQRMLYSALVDADFLDSEEFMSRDRARIRSSAAFAPIRDLQIALERHYARLDASTKAAGRWDDPVVVARNDVREDCGVAAKRETGLFTLKVPTGGGKTLAAMWFALNHAVNNGLLHVVVVIPYTSIIEQTAQVYRDIFGSENVLEHHCNVDQEDATETMRLACENWDAPIVVTTNVQFFESLFAARSSKCRKLHNLSKSVIILDEAQSLPTELLKPCLKALEELSVRYGSSVVLSTATLPVFFDRSILGSAALTGGEQGVLEIVPSTRHLERRLQRTHVERISAKVTDDELITFLKAERQALVVVNTRRHARELFQKAHAEMSDRFVLHLSAQMCGVHRASVLSRARALLASEQPCLLVSTQLIEAGVDIDFPCVFRDMAGVDSLTQAAGRCNREGRLPNGGRVIVFESADYPLPSGSLHVTAQQGRLILQLPEIADDLLGFRAVERYFTALYADAQKGNALGMDKYGVLTNLLPQKCPRSAEDMFLFKFKTIGETFRIIDSNTISVIVPYGEQGRDLCEKLRRTFDPGERRGIVRKLQRYMVSLYGREPLDREGRPIAELVHDSYWVLTSPEQYYSENFGVTTEPNEILLNV